MLADKVEHDVGAVAISRLADGLNAPVDRGLERFIRAKSAGEAEALGACVEGDYAGTAQRLQDLHPEVAKSADAKHDNGRARLDFGEDLLDRVVGGDARVGERRQRVALDTDPGAPLVTDLDGAPIEAGNLEAHLQRTRRQRVSMTFNALMCRGLLETRYGLVDNRKEG